MRRERQVLAGLSIFLLSGLLARPAAAQVLYGSALGIVEDQSGASVSGAAVTISNTAGGIVRDAQTGGDGRYSFPNLLPGSYEVKVTAPGFRTFVQSNVTITINTVTRVDIKLELGQVSEQVTVEGAVIALQTDKSDIRAEVTSKAVGNLPLAAYRNFQNLIDLVPGATPAAFQNSMGASPQRSLTTNVNGTNRNNNNTRIDGATNVYVWLPHHTLYNPPVESIETVNVSTSSFDAEQGMAGGAAVTVATKSGTNAVHGSAFWYHDNQHLYARPYFYRLSENHPRLNKSIVNIPGGTIGGPIIKNK